MAEPAPVPDDFRCVRCGHCCEWEGDVRVTDAECEAIAAFLGISFSDFICDYTRLSYDRKSLSLTDKETTKHCIFYTPDPPACLIQEVKPAHCIAFPHRWRFPGWETRCEGGRMQKTVKS